MALASASCLTPDPSPRPYYVSADSPHLYSSDFRLSDPMRCRAGPPLLVSPLSPSPPARTAPASPMMQPLPSIRSFHSSTPPERGSDSPTSHAWQSLPPLPRTHQGSGAVGLVSKEATARERWGLRAMRALGTFRGCLRGVPPTPTLSSTSRVADLFPQVAATPGGFAGWGALGPSACTPVSTAIGLRKHRIPSDLRS